MDGSVHFQGESSLLLDISRNPLLTCPEACLLGTSEASRVDGQA